MKKDIMMDCDQHFLSNQSAFQEVRERWSPTLPNALKYKVKPVFDSSVRPLQSESEAETLKGLFPETSDQTYLRFEAVDCSSNSCDEEQPLRVGVVLSGGQASGGHNVIAGIFDYLKKENQKSQLFGFLNGPHGIYSGNYRELDSVIINHYRNQGGFHMICSGRHKIDTAQQKSDALRVCSELNLDGLVVIGGDDSNTNAAILAEYFRSQKSKICVVGCPKTIDGDLRNRYVEASFGFDTAVKTYAELIGNVTSNIATCQDRYHFIRLMGRSASHIALECALQTRPNLLFVGEEIHRDNRTLSSIVNEITDLIIRRCQLNKHYGLVLLPEGLIEFIPEIGSLIGELNDMLSNGPFRIEALTEKSRNVFLSLPANIQSQLLLDRDAHGNVQVSRIATEELLMQMVRVKLQDDGYKHPVCMTGHFFGYEGRCPLPTPFDANYCYALGQTAGVILSNKLTGYMAIVQQLSRHPSEWIVAAYPLQWMMVIEKRSGKFVPVIKKYLVELDTPLFELFNSVREYWKLDDFYRHPGPIQYEGFNSHIVNYTLTLPKFEDLLPSKTNERKNCFYGLKTFTSLSPLAKHRSVTTFKVPFYLTCPVAQPLLNDFDTQNQEKINKVIYQKFPIQSQQHGMHYYDVMVPPKTVDIPKTKPNNLPMNIGVLYVGCPASGSSNILHGLYHRLQIVHKAANSDVQSSEKFNLFGFKGSYGLLNQIFLEIDESDLNLFRNDSGFEMLGVTLNTDSQLGEPKGLENILLSCQNLKLNGLVLIGNHVAVSYAPIIAEYLLEQHCNTCVVVVPTSYENSLGHSIIEACIGSHSASRCCSSIVGNIQTDAASAKKYWYIVRFVSHMSSLNVIDVAFETHPNCCIIGERYAKQPQPLVSLISDLVDVICTRSEQDKNFGVILFSDALLYQIQELSQLMYDLDQCFEKFNDQSFAQLVSDFETIYKSNILNIPQASDFSASSIQLLQKITPSLHRTLIQNKSVMTRDIPLESIITTLIELELQDRKKINRFSGIFTPVPYLIESQGVTPIPTDFDCQLALTHGYLACIAVESMLTGYITSIKNTRDSVDSWKASLIPLLHITNIYSHIDSVMDKIDLTLIQFPQVDLKSLFFMRLQHVEKEWNITDCYCNPGPIQLSSSF